MWDVDCRPLTTPSVRRIPGRRRNRVNNNNNAASNIGGQNAAGDSGGNDYEYYYYYYYDYDNVSELQNVRTHARGATTLPYQADIDVDLRVTERGRNGPPEPGSGNIFNVEYTSIGAIIFFVACCALFIPMIYARHKRNRELLAPVKLADLPSVESGDSPANSNAKNMSSGGSDATNTTSSSSSSGGDASNTTKSSPSDTSVTATSGIRSAVGRLGA